MTESFLYRIFFLGGVGGVGLLSLIYSYIGFIPIKFHNKFQIIIIQSDPWYMYLLVYSITDLTFYSL